MRRAISGNEHFELSLIEMNEDGYTYTYRTLERMQQERKDADYYFIIGADSLYNFETWMEPARICQAARIVVATRDHTEEESLDREMHRFICQIQRHIPEAGQPEYRYFIPDAARMDQ